MVKVRRGIRIRPKKKQLKGDGFFDGLKRLTDLSYIFGTPKIPIIADKPAPSQQATQENTGIPDKAILKTIADNSYKATSDEMAPVPGFTLKEKTPTLVFYQKDGENIMVIGVRGTADFRDFRAWFSTAFSVIPDSQRFKEDLATVTEFQQRFPVSSFTYYATGHSLGGTLIDELIKRGMVKEARTYNPAIETSDIPNVELSKKNKRIYADGDPLYLLQGRFDNPTEVRPSYKYYPSSVMDYIPGYDKYKQHVLANPVFTGGDQDEVEMEPKDYYQEHRNIVSLLNKTGKTLMKEAKEQKKEAIQMAKKLGHPSPFYHLRGAGLSGGMPFRERREGEDFSAWLAEQEQAVDDDMADLQAWIDAQQAINEQAEAAHIAHMADLAAMADVPISQQRKEMRFQGGRIDPNEELPDDDDGRIYIREDDDPPLIPPEEEEDPQVLVDREALENYARAQFDTAFMLIEDDGSAPQNRTIRFGPNGEVIPQTEALIRRLYDTYVREDLNDNQLLRAQMLEQIINQIRQSYNDYTNPPPVNEGSGKRKGRGFFDDIKKGFKKGIESRVGKIPEPAVLSPEQQADARRRQHIQDVDKQREKMVAQKKKIAIDDMMEYAGKENVLKAIYAREGTDNPKDYLARVVEKAKKRAEEFYPY